jgi:SPX domain protein involved in polyphosphate accumulation
MSYKMQASRYELKYIIPEEQARKVRDFVMNYLDPDEHTDPETGLGYPTHSLYLDSPDLKLCKATIMGDKNRYKLRLRFYDDNPDTPVFFEIKRRMNDVIMKQRAGVWKSSVPHLLAGAWPKKSDLIKADDKNYKALYNFCDLRDSIRAGPAAYTSYMREAYEPKDSNLYRVTFDRLIKGGAYDGTLNVKTLEKWARPQVDGVVLELKFTDRFPNWMHDCVQIFNLRRTTMPKYVECVSILDGSPLRYQGRKMKPQPYELA